MLLKAQEGRKTFQWNVFRREPSQGVPCKTNIASNREKRGRLRPPLRSKEMLRALPLSGEPPHPRRRIGFASKTSTFAIEVC